MPPYKLYLKLSIFKWKVCKLYSNYVVAVLCFCFYSLLSVSWRCLPCV